MNAILLRLCNGDDVVKEVIEQEMKLAYQLAHVFKMTNPNKQNDIQSAAFEGLVEGVNHIHDDPDNKDYMPSDVRPILNRKIRQSIIDFLRED